MSDDEVPPEKGAAGVPPTPKRTEATPSDASLKTPVHSDHGTPLPNSPPAPAPPPAIPQAPNLPTLEDSEENLTAEQLAQLLDSWDDDALDLLDSQAAAKDSEADSLTHYEVFLDRLKHLFFTTVWFVIFAAVAIALDLLAPQLKCWGVTEDTRRPLELGAHLLMYADLVLLAIQLLETIGVQAVRAYRKVMEASQ